MVLFVAMAAFPGCCWFCGSIYRRPGRAQACFRCWGAGFRPVEGMGQVRSRIRPRSLTSRGIDEEADRHLDPLAGFSVCLVKQKQSILLKK